MNSQTRLSGIRVSRDRFISVNGPPLKRLPNWGLTTRTPEVSYHLHPAITYEVHYCVPLYVLVHAFTGAKGRCAVGGVPMADWTAEPRSTRIVAPGTSVRVIQTKPLEFLAIGIQPQRVERVLDRLNLKMDALAHYFETSDPALVALFGEIRRSMIAEPVGTGDYLDSLADAIVARLSTRHLARAPEKAKGPEMLSPALVRRLADWIEDRISAPIRVNDLVAQSGLSRAHFSRAFAKSFGLPPRAYIMSRRIARARALLGETDLPITQIAIKCGFANPSHLTTAFRNEIGLTPSEYRNALTQPDWDGRMATTGVKV